MNPWDEYYLGPTDKMAEKEQPSCETPTGKSLYASLNFSERGCLVELHATRTIDYVESSLEKADDHLQDITGLGVEGRRMYMRQGDYEFIVGDLCHALDEKDEELRVGRNYARRLQIQNDELLKKFESVERLIEEGVQAELKRRDELRAPVPTPGRRQLILEDHAV